DRRHHSRRPARQSFRSGPASARHRRQHLQRQHPRLPGRPGGLRVLPARRPPQRGHPAGLQRHHAALAGADQHQRQQREPRRRDADRHRDGPALPAGPERARRQVQLPPHSSQDAL
ncbi:MAG: Flagellar basal-body rod protein FlgB, partial [uncultured Blastococcus sp.]